MILKKVYNIIFIYSLLTILAHLLVSFYISYFDNVTVINLFVLFLIFIIFFIMLRISIGLLNLKSILTLSFFFKISIMIIAFDYLYYFNNGFFQHAFLGDDRVYYKLANEYSCDISTLIKEENSFYGLPFAIFLSFLNCFLPSIEFYRVINILISVFNIYLFFIILKNISPKNINNKLILFVTLLYGLNIIVSIFDTLFYKDILVQFFFLLFLANITKPKVKIINFIFIGIAILVTFYFRYMLGAIEIFIFSLILLTNSNYNLYKKVFIFILGLLFILGFIFIFKDKINSIMLTFSLFDARISNVTALFTHHIDLSLSKLLLAASMFLDIAPMNIIHYDTEWYVIEGLVASGRLINSVLSVFMYIGIFLIIFNKEKEIRYNKIFLFTLVVFILGMALTGQVLVDRHKMMLYPLVYIFIYISLLYLNKYQNFKKFNYLFFIIFSFKLAIQILYAIIRSKMYV